MAIFKTKNHEFELGKKTYIMGILNVTPDSFSDGGEYLNIECAINKALDIQNCGADILDIGAQSTRPGYTRISPDEELKRIIPILTALQGQLHIPISIDTFYPEVALESTKYDIDIINDVSGFRDKRMYAIMLESNCGAIIMHDMPGTNIKPFFEEKLLEAKKIGINPNRICFDPGIGFSKTYEENIYIIKHLNKYIIPDCAMLIGASRKRVIGQSCGNPEFKQRTAGTIAAHTIAINGGVDFIRVHDVSESVQAAKVADSILRNTY